MSAGEQRLTDVAAGLATPTAPERSGWARSLSEAIRSRTELLGELGLEDSEAIETDFPVLVPRSYLARMRPRDWSDPLLKQVLPVVEENDVVAGFGLDAVGDQAARVAPGMIHKYEGRVLLIATGACAVHCRYCFRRHYPYRDDPRRLDDWQPALEAIAADATIQEVILSGGDPLMLTDRRLEELVRLISEISHVRRLRLHTRLPIVLPDRVTDSLLRLLDRTTFGLQPWVVVHANHGAEVVDDCAEALEALVSCGIPVLNQAVLLRGVNDSEAALVELSERLIDLGVQPYYLHLLDRVAGTAHFEVAEAAAVELLASVRRRLPGFAVPRLVREEPGMSSKTPITSL